MKDWRVVGIHRDTGERMELTIHAFSEQTVREKCFEQACVIETIAAVRDVGPGESPPPDSQTGGPAGPRRTGARRQSEPWKVNGWPIRNGPARAVYVVEQPRMTIHNFFATALAVGIGVGCIAPILGLVLAVIGFGGLLSSALSAAR